MNLERQLEGHDGFFAGSIYLRYTYHGLEKGFDLIAAVLNQATLFPMYSYRLHLPQSSLSMYPSQSKS
ncbi:hypothetical protein STZ1_10442 [Bacillus subtilis]